MSNSELFWRIFIEKLDDYKEIIKENNNLYHNIVGIIEKKTNPNNQQDTCLQINKALLSKVDDILEDFATVNLNMKLLRYFIQNNIPISISERENERDERIKNISTNNMLPPLFIMYDLLENNLPNFN